MDWIHILKGVSSIAFLAAVVYLARRRLAEMAPADAAKARRRILITLLAAGLLIGLLTVAFLKVAP